MKNKTEDYGKDYNPHHDFEEFCGSLEYFYKNNIVVQIRKVVQGNQKWVCSIYKEDFHEDNKLCEGRSSSIMESISECQLDFRRTKSLIRRKEDLLLDPKVLEALNILGISKAQFRENK